ncbi:MAG TPA: hypothetical protein VGQ48_07415 [Gemmatimonadales bacterium]|jgi:hypothetical protein|nr:hypothetical protein [Gemmatimonadales bacterium]
MSERFEELARELGARAAQRLDVEATAQKVVQRLREEPAARRRVWIPQTWLRIAAAIVIVVGGAVVASRLTPGRHPGVSAHAAHLVADDLSDLSADELRAVLTSFEALVAGDSVAVPESGTDLRELDAQQLRAVLRSLEG